MPWTLTQGLSLAEPFTVYPPCLSTGQTHTKPQPTGCPSTTTATTTTTAEATAARAARLRRMVMMKRFVDAAQLTMLLIAGVSLACYPSPSPYSWRDQAHRSAVVIEGKVQSTSISNHHHQPHQSHNSQQQQQQEQQQQQPPHQHHQRQQQQQQPASQPQSHSDSPHSQRQHQNQSQTGSRGESYSVSVRVLDVWPVNTAGLQRNQLITVGDFGSDEAPCVTVKENQKYIFFMNLTDQPLVFKTSFAPLDSSSGKHLKKDVEKILCQNCADGIVSTPETLPLMSSTTASPQLLAILPSEPSPEANGKQQPAPRQPQDIGVPKLKKLKNQTLQEGQRLSLKCEASGNPQLVYRWFKDGMELKKNGEIKIKTGKKNSRLHINKVKLQDAGEYTCEAENGQGKVTSKCTINVQAAPTPTPSPNLSTPSPTPTPESPESGHARRCNKTETSYCVNGGVCYYIDGINKLSCKCHPGFFGQRCMETEPLRSYKPDLKHLGFEFMEAEELYQKRVLTITGICVALLVVGIVCVVAYCKTKKQRKKMHNHLRQNLCADHQNRNLANGPNHPGPLPEDIQMVDYVSKNVPASEHVRRHETETSFSGSQPSSTSHRSSTATHTSSHRNGERTWSVDQTESMTSEMHSGMMTSSLDTSKCNSPVEPRGRLSAVCGFHDSRHPMLHCRDSVDSLRDSPHSDRYVSALTTPARLSPVEFHYSLPVRAPSFELSPRVSAPGSSLPPGAGGYRVEEEQPLLRRNRPYPTDNQRHDPYKQRRNYLHDSFGSLPPSPLRTAEDDEYETTQEYIPAALERPRKVANSSRRWRKTKPNGHISHRAECDCDCNTDSGTCSSDSDCDGEKVGERTPFLNSQNPPGASTTEQTSLFRLPDTRTFPSDRHNARESLQTRAARTRSSRDSAAV